MSILRQSLAVCVAAILAFVEASPLAFQKTSTNPQYLAKRLMTGVACGLFSTGAGKDIIASIGVVSEQGSGNAEVPTHKCSRVACTNTSDAYICNDQDVDITVPLSEVTGYLNTADNYCRPPEGVSYTNDAIMSGQIFTDDHGGYNVAIGYADCNHDPNRTHAVCLARCMIFAAASGCIFILVAICVDTKRSRWPLAAWSFPIILAWMTVWAIFAEHVLYFIGNLLPASCDASMEIEGAHGTPCTLKRFREWTVDFMHGDAGLDDMEPKWVGMGVLSRALWTVAIIISVNLTIEHRREVERKAKSGADVEKPEDANSL